MNTTKITSGPDKWTRNRWRIIVFQAASPNIKNQTNCSIPSNHHRGSNTKARKTSVRGDVVKNGIERERRRLGEFRINGNPLILYSLCMLNFIHQQVPTVSALSMFPSAHSSSALPIRLSIHAGYYASCLVF